MSYLIISSNVMQLWEIFYSELKKNEKTGNISRSVCGVELQTIGNI